MTPTCLILSIESIQDNIGLLTSLTNLNISNTNISGSVLFDSYIINNYDSKMYNCLI
jgi:hypothetical protein